MADEIFSELEGLVKTQGVKKAIDHLAEQMIAQKDYNKLFYTLLVKSRLELGLNVVPTAPSNEIPVMYRKNSKITSGFLREESQNFSSRKTISSRLGIFIE